MFKTNLWNIFFRGLICHTPIKTWIRSQFSIYPANIILCLLPCRSKIYRGGSLSAESECKEFEDLSSTIFQNSNLYAITWCGWSDAVRQVSAHAVLTSKQLLSWTILSDLLDVRLCFWTDLHFLWFSYNGTASCCDQMTFQIIKNAKDTKNRISSSFSHILLELTQFPWVKSVIA